jgi:hypothetical protein
MQWFLRPGRRTRQSGRQRCAANDSFAEKTNIIFADEFYFSLFEQDWLAGSKQTALKDPYQVVLTEERAKTYFGNLPANDIIGKQITYDDSIKTTVSGIVKDQTEKATDFRFKGSFHWLQ